MKLIKRRTFFEEGGDKSEQGETEERVEPKVEKKKQESKAKTSLIFGINCKNQKDFRKEYFQKTLVVPEGLQVLNEDSNQRKNSRNEWRLTTSNTLGS